MKETSAVLRRVSLNTESGVVRRTSRSFRGFKQGCCFFGYREHIFETSFDLSPSQMLQAPTLQPQIGSADGGSPREHVKMCPVAVVNVMTSA
jgi:hypothetical protein